MTLLQKQTAQRGQTLGGKKGGDTRCTARHDVTE